MTYEELLDTRLCDFPLSIKASPLKKRLARLNIDLNAGLVGVRILFEIIDSPPTEPNDDDKPALKITEARVEFNDVRFGYRPGEIVIRAR
jgi:ATP-binding cassette subfamily B protein